MAGKNAKYIFDLTVIVGNSIAEFFSVQGCISKPHFEKIDESKALPFAQQNLPLSGTLVQNADGYAYLKVVPPIISPLKRGLRGIYSSCQNPTIPSKTPHQVIMNPSLILGILPLLAFVIIDMFLGLKAGVISAIMLAILEALYSFHELGTLDYLSMASLVLVLVFGGLSYLSKNPLYIKLQPVLLGLSFSVVVFLFQAFGEPILMVMLKKYGSLIPKEFTIDLTNAFVVSLLRKTSLYLGFGLFIHALIVLYSALKLNNWWWLFMRGIGLYLILALTFLIVRFA